MTTRTEQLVLDLQQHFGATDETCCLETHQASLTVSAEQLLDVALTLRDEPQFRFEQLIDLCAVDYQTYGQSDWQTQQSSNSGFSRGVSSNSEPGEEHSFPARFQVVYQLMSVSTNRRLRLKVWVDGEPPCIPSVIDIWKSADWYEREAFDLFGILFNGHPDLRRILTDYGFVGHPFRKDFPLEGHVEVRYDPELKRVIYQPVTIENRVLVPRVIRKDQHINVNTDEGAG